jgi:hypothetical protein
VVRSHDEPATIAIGSVGPVDDKFVAPYARVPSALKLLLAPARNSD